MNDDALGMFVSIVCLSAVGIAILVFIIKAINGKVKDKQQDSEAWELIKKFRDSCWKDFYDTYPACPKCKNHSYYFIVETQVYSREIIATPQYSNESSDYPGRPDIIGHPDPWRNKKDYFVGYSHSVRFNASRYIQLRCRSCRSKVGDYSTGHKSDFPNGFDHAPYNEYLKDYLFYTDEFSEEWDHLIGGKIVTRGVSTGGPVKDEHGGVKFLYQSPEIRRGEVNIGNVDDFAKFGGAGWHMFRLSQASNSIMDQLNHMHYGGRFRLDNYLYWWKLF